MEAGREERVERSVGRIAAFLRRHVPDLSDADEGELRAFVRRSKEEANGVGIRSEQGIARFALLSLATGGRAAEDPNVRRLFHRSGASPDDDIKRLLDACTAQLAERGRR